MRVHGKPSHLDDKLYLLRLNLENKGSDGLIARTNLLLKEVLWLLCMVIILIRIVYLHFQVLVKDQVTNVGYEVF